MAKSSWDIALLRKLGEEKFSGHLTMIFADGKVVGITTDEQARFGVKRQARKPRVVKEQAATAAAS